MRRLAIAMGLGFQVSSLILCSVLGSLLLGVWLDCQLGSAPCLTMVFMVIGLSLAVIGAYRLAKRMSD